MKTRTWILPLLLTGCVSNPINPAKNRISGAGSILTEEASFLTIGGDENFTKIGYCKLLQGYEFADEDCAMDISKVELTEGNEIARRNDLQARIIGASNQKCGQYLAFIHENKAFWETGLGGFSSLLAGAGAVVSHGPTAQAFSAAAGVAGAVRAERNQAYFANLAIEVLTSGIKSRRAKILEDIAAKRAKHDPGVDGHVHYSISGAISDAVQYHASCNAITGFEVAAESISRADHPGPEELKRFFEGFGELGLSMEVIPTGDGAGPAAPQKLTFERR